MEKIRSRIIHCIADGKDYLATEGLYGEFGLTVTISPPEAFDLTRDIRNELEGNRAKARGNLRGGLSMRGRGRQRISVVEFREGIRIRTGGARH